MTCLERHEAERWRARALDIFTRAADTADPWATEGGLANAKDEARRTAESTVSCLFDRLVGPLVRTIVQDRWTFVIYPDGAQLGHEPNGAASATRQAFVDALLAAEEPPDWLHVSYGDDGETIRATKNGRVPQESALRAAYSEVWNRLEQRLHKCEESTDYEQLLAFVRRMDPLKLFPDGAKITHTPVSAIAAFREVLRAQPNDEARRDVLHELGLCPCCNA